MKIDKMMGALQLTINTVDGLSRVVTKIDPRDLNDDFRPQTADRMKAKLAKAAQLLEEVKFTLFESQETS